MASADREHWDARYQELQRNGETALPVHFAEFADVFASASTAIDVACGAGRTSVWLAQRGVVVTGYDVSPVAIRQSVTRAERNDVGETCTFVVADLDDGLPAGDRVDLVVCNMFRDPNLDQALVDRLARGGILAVAALSEVDASPGRFRAKPGELTAAFDSVEHIAHDEGDGVAWLVARKA